MPKRLLLELKTHTRDFDKRFKLNACTSDYMHYNFTNRYYQSTVTIYRTCAKCYRVMTYVSYLQVQKASEYKSFRSISDLCVYLENLASRLN